MSTLSREESILTSLRRILRAVALHGRQLQRQHDLTAPQLLCLRFLRDQDEPPTAGEVAKAISLSQATVTGLLDRLERKHLAVRRRGQKDRRRVRIELTEDGRRAAWDAPLPLHERFAHRLALLPDHAARQIDEVLQDVVQMMEAEGIDAAPMLVAEPTLTEADAATDSEPDRTSGGDPRPAAGPSTAPQPHRPDGD